VYAIEVPLEFGANPSLISSTCSPMRNYWADFVNKVHALRAGACVQQVLQVR
jgi:hypothetical protein